MAVDQYAETGRRMESPPIETLRRAAAGGDVEALTRLGERLMDTDQPSEMAEAVSVLDQATRGGAAEAPAKLAVMFAMGAGPTRNWIAALDLLRIGAERGSASARDQLIALTGEPAPDHAGGWSRLRESIDLAAWTREGPSETLCKSPRIHRRADFLSPAVAAWIIARGAGRVARARVFDPDAPGTLEEEARTNSAAAFRLADMDVVMAMVRLRVAAAVGADSGALEPPQVLHYELGQRFEPHFDFFDPALPGHVRDLAEHGQRTATFLIYLNDDFEGGETDFPILGQRYKAPAGGAVWFFNTQAAGTPDRRTLHAGLPPTRGEKWLLSQWIRDRPRT